MVLKSTVIITGAGGFAGLNISRYFVQQGYKVVGLDINEDSLKKIKECGAEELKCDLLKDDLVPIFKNADYLIHIAGLFRFDAPTKKLYLINTKLVDKVMKAASKVDFKHIIHLSTTATYGVSKKLPVTEDFPQKPIDTYGKTKFLGEKIAWEYYRENNLPITVIRPTLIYGPENPYGMGIFIAFASLLKDGLRLKKFISFKGGSYIHLVHVKDIARICEFLLNRKDTIGQAYNAADDTPMRVGTFIETMSSIFEDLDVLSFIPHSKFLLKFLIKIFRTRASHIMNRILDKTWKIFARKAGFNPNKFYLSLSPEWLGYFVTDFMYSNKKLHDLGFKFKYPHPKKGILENIIWYKKNNWIA
ncbi:MAG: NAD-dependent epimerase/dehydratase family protein [Promethearchaeota archaeon]